MDAFVLYVYNFAHLFGLFKCQILEELLDLSVENIKYWQVKNSVLP